MNDNRDDVSADEVLEHSPGTPWARLDFADPQFKQKLEMLYLGGVFAAREQLETFLRDMGVPEEIISREANKIEQQLLARARQDMANVERDLRNGA